MQQVAERDGFRHIFFGMPSIGGRYSALSNFGLVPAAVMGLNLQRFLDFVPNAQVHRLENAGHLILEDAPEEAIDAIRGFLARAPSQSAGSAPLRQTSRRG